MSLSLSQFLSANKRKFLDSIRLGANHDWTVVMGNEAADLDSLASSIAFSYFRSTYANKPTIAYIQSSADDLVLRPENIYALGLAGISNPATDLLFASDISGVHPFPASKFALVDHNHLSSAFGPDDADVVAVLDHHEDEGFHKGASPRIVAPAGSCASHVTEALFEPSMPADLATLLLSAIMIDTGGLKPGGKALQVDHDATAHLLPISTLGSNLAPSETLIQLSNEISERKVDVTHLTPRDLLRRDYKEYFYQPDWLPSEIKAGLSTVPLRLKTWGADGKLENAAVAWMEERNLHILGVLTSYHDPRELNSKGKPKHKRQQAWFIKLGEHTEEAARRLWTGLEGNEELRVEASGMELTCPEGFAWKVYRQKNANATRKAVAPHLKSIIQP